VCLLWHLTRLVSLQQALVVADSMLLNKEKDYFTLFCCLPSDRGLQTVETHPAD
jgi:hypothetical protein